LKAVDREPRAGLGELAKTWFVIATQSFGGGPSTLFLMRQHLVERRRWLSDREYLEDWVVAKLSLGIGFIALTGLIGRRIAGNPGIAVSVASLLLPSAAITLLLTIGYESVRNERWLIASFSGIGAVTAGMIVGIAFTFGRQSVRRGRSGFVDSAYWVFAILAILIGRASPVLLIASGIAVGLTLMRGELARAGGDPAP
jgi:chromate transporter